VRGRGGDGETIYEASCVFHALLTRWVSLCLAVERWLVSDFPMVE